MYTSVCIHATSFVVCTDLLVSLQAPIGALHLVDVPSYAIMTGCNDYVTWLFSHLCLRACGCKFILTDGWASSWQYTSLRKEVLSRTKVVQSLTLICQRTTSGISLQLWLRTTFCFILVSYFCHEYCSCIIISSPTQSKFKAVLSAIRRGIRLLHMPEPRWCYAPWPHCMLLWHHLCWSLQEEVNWHVLALLSMTGHNACVKEHKNV